MSNNQARKRWTGRLRARGRVLPWLNWWRVYKEQHYPKWLDL